MKNKILLVSVLFLGVATLSGCVGKTPEKSSSDKSQPVVDSGNAKSSTQSEKKPVDEIDREISDLDKEIDSIDENSDFGEDTLSDSAVGL